MKKIILSCMLSGLCAGAFANDSSYNQGHRSDYSQKDAMIECHMRINGNPNVAPDPHMMKNCLDSKGVPSSHYDKNKHDKMKHGYKKHHDKDISNQSYYERKDLHRSPDQYP